MTNKDAAQNDKKKGLFSKLFKGNNDSGSCCNVKIVPKEQPKENKDLKK